MLNSPSPGPFGVTERGRARSLAGISSNQSPSSLSTRLSEARPPDKGDCASSRMTSSHRLTNRSSILGRGAY